MLIKKKWRNTTRGCSFKTFRIYRWSICRNHVLLGDLIIHFSKKVTSDAISIKFLQCNGVTGKITRSKVHRKIYQIVVTDTPEKKKTNLSHINGAKSVTKNLIAKEIINLMISKCFRVFDDSKNKIMIIFIIKNKNGKEIFEWTQESS